MTSPSTTSPKNKTDLDYGSIPTMDSVTKATILDELDPLVQERVKAQKQKRLGVAASVALLLVVLAAVTLTQKKTPSQVEDPKTTLDHRFASLLVDDQAFFFPTETSRNAGSRRSLASEGPDVAASSANPWALAWTDNKDGYAAVGAYYHAKGKAIGHYYKSLYKASCCCFIGQQVMNLPLYVCSALSHSESTPWLLFSFVSVSPSTTRQPKKPVLPM